MLRGDKEHIAEVVEKADGRKVKEEEEVAGSRFADQEKKQEDKEKGMQSCRLSGFPKSAFSKRQNAMPADVSNVLSELQPIRSQHWKYPRRKSVMLESSFRRPKIWRKISPCCAPGKRAAGARL